MATLRRLRYNAGTSPGHERSTRRAQRLPAEVMAPEVAHPWFTAMSGASFKATHPAANDVDLPPDGEVRAESR
ncbi:MAG TPA: hypothetical protein VGD46_23600 [Rhizobacter sp.]